MIHIIKWQWNCVKDIALLLSTHFFNVNPFVLSSSPRSCFERSHINSVYLAHLRGLSIIYAVDQGEFYSSMKYVNSNYGSLQMHITIWKHHLMQPQMRQGFDWLSLFFFSIASHVSSMFLFILLQNARTAWFIIINGSTMFKIMMKSNVHREHVNGIECSTEKHP